MGGADGRAVWLSDVAHPASPIIRSDAQRNSRMLDLDENILFLYRDRANGSSAPFGL
jgi:hypothetical protein